MRHPPPQTLFPPLALSAGQAAQYERLAHALVQDAVAAYDHFCVNDKRVVDTTRWKAVTRRANVVVYKECKRQSSTTTHSSSTSSRHALSTPTAAPLVARTSSAGLDPLAQTMGFTTSAFAITEPQLQPTELHHLPKLLAIGSIDGALDDVMFGIVASTTAAMRLNSSYIHTDALVDGAVLATIDRPTPRDPFRFLGIKWLLYDPRKQQQQRMFASWRTKSRDVVVLEYCSVLVRPTGERIGVHVVRSIDVATCRELTDVGIKRASVSVCFVYCELSGGKVDVFMTARVAPRGRNAMRAAFVEALAVRSVASTLSSCALAVACAQSKKLAWLLQHSTDCGDAIQQQLLATTSNRARESVDDSAFDRSSVVLSDITSPANAFATTKRPAKQQTRQRAAGCSHCSRPIRAFATAATCARCYKRLCSRCWIVQTLSSATLGTTIVQTTMRFCRTCIASAHDASAAAIAMYEVVQQQQLRHTHVQLRDTSSASSSSAATFLTRDSTTTLSASCSYADPRASERHAYACIFGGGNVDEMDDDSAACRTSSKRFASSMRPSFAWTSSGRESVVTTDALSPADLNLKVDDDVDPVACSSRKDIDTMSCSSSECMEPVLLNERVTCGALRAMDCVDSNNRLSIEGDESASIAASSVYLDEYDDSDSVVRMSYTSSVALLDHDNNESEADDDDSVARLPWKPNHDATDMCVDEGDEDDEDVGKGVDEEDGDALTTASPQSKERISQIHALVRAQSLGYERPTTATRSSVSALSIRQSGRSAQHESDLPVVAAYPIAAERIATTHDDLGVIRQRAQTQSSYQMQLWMQMNDLRDAAENTYQVTKRNTETLLRSQQVDVSESASARTLRTVSQPFQFNVTGLRAGRSMTTVAAAPPRAAGATAILPPPQLQRHHTHQ